jgi:hypothetical protein
MVEQEIGMKGTRLASLMEKQRGLLVLLLTRKTTY